MTASDAVLRRCVTVGVLALQGAFSEHLQMLRLAILSLGDVRKVHDAAVEWVSIEVRTHAELAACDALILPGGESTTMSLVAERSGMLEPLRDFVKVQRKPTWGTCAGLILLAECANRTKKGGQGLIGGLDVRVSRNHFGRQTESFTADLPLPFLMPIPTAGAPMMAAHFPAVFIRAPVVEKILPHKDGIQNEEAAKQETVVAPSKVPMDDVARAEFNAHVEIMARLPSRSRAIETDGVIAGEDGKTGDIIAVRQGNVFGTSFHPELTDDPRVHVWWLQQILRALERR